LLRVFYNLLLLLLWLFKPILLLLDPKFAQREKAWKNVLSDNLNKIRSKGFRKTIWIHSASMGEFEQAKPLIEKFKSTEPNVFIVCTFFSPSGYENQKFYPNADVLLYLPLDFPWRSRKFLDLIQPDLAIFVKYEFWLNYLSILNRRGIPAFIVAASKPFRGNSFVYRIYLKTCLNLVTKVFSMSEIDYEFFQNLKLKVPVKLEYDTRFDRVYSKIRSMNELPFAKKDFGEDFVVVAGSIWEPDLQILIRTKKILENSIASGTARPLRIVYVPHEPKESFINLIERLDSATIRFSKLLDLNDNKELLLNKLRGNNIIVDKVGYLLALYGVGNIAYVGGGFGRGIHSIVEPAGYGLPIICGGNIQNSTDAMSLREIGALFMVQNEDELSTLLTNLMNEKFYESISIKVKTYFMQRIGATDRIVNDIMTFLTKPKK